MTHCYNIGCLATNVAQLIVSANRPFSKMAAENSNKLKWAKIKNVYQY